MDGCPRQNPAYRPATGRASARGLFLFRRRARYLEAREEVAHEARDQPPQARPVARPVPGGRPATAADSFFQPPEHTGEPRRDEWVFLAQGTPEDWEILVAYTEHMRFKRDETVIRANENDRSLYFVTPAAWT